MSLADQPFVTATMPIVCSDQAGMLSSDSGIQFRCCACHQMFGELWPPVGGVRVKCHDCGTWNSITIVASRAVSGDQGNVDVWVVAKWHGKDVEEGLMWQG